MTAPAPGGNDGPIYSEPKTKMTDETPRGGPSLSVVIPFYKDQVYLEEAVASAAGQPIADLEIIVVNDNPGEESDAFLAGVAARHPVRIVRHEVNRGLAAARNTGIEAATKPWVTFIDADDVFVAGGLAANLDFARKTGAEITHSPTLSMFVGRLHPQPLRRDHLLFGRRIERANLESAPQAQYIVSSWSSIYRREFLNGGKIRFDEAQTRFEDRLFVLDAVFAAKHIAFCDIPARIWRRRLGSITTGERAMADIAMQLDLLSKCVASARAYAEAAPGREMALQRELHHSICRVIWDVRVLDFMPEESPALDGARARFTEALRGLPLKRAVFADPPTMEISHLGRAAGGYAAVSWRMLLEGYRLAQEGRWADLVAWRRAQRLPAPPQIAAPQSDKELILHIGLHKTGSTFLQRMLERDRPRLAKHGVLFPKTGFVANVNFNRRSTATPGHVGFSSALRTQGAPAFGKLAAECAESPCPRVLISAENLSFPFDMPEDRATFLARAEEAFAAFRRRRIIVVYRRPDEYVERYWREHVFLGTAWARRSAEQFASELGPQMTDLTFLAGDWAEFAGGNIDCISYDAAGKALHEAFYGALDLTPPEGRAGANEVTYPSPTAEQAIAGRAIAMARIEKGPKAEALAGFLAATGALPAARGASALSPETRVALIDRFAERSLPFLRAHGADAPVAEWRREAEAAPPPPAPDHRYTDAAIAALAQVWGVPFEVSRPSRLERAERFGRRILSQFW